MNHPTIHRALSLLLSFSLALSLPIFASADDAADSGLTFDTGLTAAPQRAAARAVKSYIQFYKDYKYIYANCNPVVIKGDGNGTYIYDTEGNLFPVYDMQDNLLTEKIDVSGCTIVGGSYNGHVQDSASITMESGTVKTIYGGTYGRTMTGSSSVTLNGGTVTTIYGGSYSATQNGDSNVILNGGTVTNTVYGGGYNCKMPDSTARITINDNANIVNPSTGNGGWVFGGGYGYYSNGNFVENTEIVYNGGNLASSGVICGGSYYGKTTNNHIIIAATPQSTFICGGGYSGTTDGKATIEFRNVVATDTSFYLSGTDRNGGSVKEAEIIVDDTCDFTDLYELTALYPENTTSTLGSLTFRIKVKAKDNFQGKLDGSGVAGKVSVHYFTDEKTVPQINHTLTDIDEVIIDHCKFTPTYCIESLDRLELHNEGVFNFPPSKDGYTAAIEELISDNGSLMYQASTVNGVPTFPPTVRVNHLTIAPGTTLKLDRTMLGTSNKEWEKHVFLSGPAVKALDSLDCLTSVAKDYIPKKTSDGSGILLLPETRPAVKISGNLDKESYPYGETMTVSAQLVRADYLTPIANKSLRLTTYDNLWFLTDATTDEEGKAVFQTPLNESVYTEYIGGRRILLLTFLGDEAYQYVNSNVYFNGHTYTGFKVTPAEITLTGDLPVPTPEGDLTFDLSTDPSAFYTAQVKWALAEEAENHKTYTASLQIFPKAGFALADGRVSAITYNGQAYDPAGMTPESDGSFLIPGVGSYTENTTPTHAVSLFTSPNTVGKVTGAGHYPEGSSVTVTAVPTRPSNNSIAAWSFLHWTEDGQVVSTDAAYTFTITGPRTLTAVFIPSYEITLTASQGGVVTGGGPFPNGKEITVTASPETGYVFERWTEDGKTVSTDARYTFTVTGPRSLIAVFAPQEPETETRVIAPALTEIPEGLKQKYTSVEKIAEDLKLKVKAELAHVGDQIVVLDVRLQYKDKGGQWIDVTPENFPEGGLPITLPYPNGTNGEDYTFTIQHMISHGPNAGEIETLKYQSTEEGLQCHFTSLSPVAIGYKLKTTQDDQDDPPKPPVTDPDPEKPAKPQPSSPSYSSDSKEDSAPSKSQLLWQTVREKIESAQPGAVIHVNARDLERLPASVLKALRQSDGVTLILRWSGGDPITLTPQQAYPEPLRLAYPFSSLAERIASKEGTSLEAASETGGCWEIDARSPEEAIFLPAEPAPASPEPQETLETDDRADNPHTGLLPGEQSSGQYDFAPIVLAILLAVACIGVWVCKNFKYL